MHTSGVTPRTLFFGSAAWFAGALAFYHEREQGLSTGVIQVGGRGGVKLIPVETDPNNFEFWVNAYAVLLVVSVVLATVSLLLGFQAVAARKNK